MMPELLHFKIRLESDLLWATVDELRASLEEGISLYLSEPGNAVDVTIADLGSEPMEITAHAELQ